MDVSGGTGAGIYGSETPLFRLFGPYVVTAEQLFDHLNVILKNACTTNPFCNTHPVRECTFLASPRKVPKEGDLRGHFEQACPLKKPLRRLAGQRPKMFRFLNAYGSKCFRFPWCGFPKTDISL